MAPHQTSGNGNDTRENDNNNKCDGDLGVVIALIDFPKGGSIFLDGQSIVVKTDDFVGVKNVPSKKFHLVTCKGNGGGFSTTTSTNNTSTAVTVGFIVFGGCNANNGSGADSNHLIRRWDPRTEEVSSDPIDEMTKLNLLQQINRNEVFVGAGVLRYDQIVSIPGTWIEQTRYINESSELLLKTLRGLKSGDKIVPGFYDPAPDRQKTKGIFFVQQGL